MDIRDAIKANNTAIEAIDLVKDYGSGSNAVHALRDVNIAFEQGKFTVIMGPSGSGKSTLMHTLAGLDSATSGHVMFDGKDLTRMNDDQLTLLRRHQIGFIFQSFNLLPIFGPCRGRNQTDSGCVCWWKRLALRNVLTIVRTNYREANSSVWPSREH